MKTICRAALALTFLAAQRVAAQEAVDLSTVAKICEEGFQRSHVMQFAEYMTDVLGPRLTGSPGLRRAEVWAKTTLTRLGLTNMDFFDRLPADDMRRNAVILASMVYHAAMRNDPLPREGR